MPVTKASSSFYPCFMLACKPLQVRFGYTQQLFYENLWSQGTKHVSISCSVQGLSSVQGISSNETLPTKESLQLRSVCTWRQWYRLFISSAQLLKWVAWLPILLFKHDVRKKWQKNASLSLSVNGPLIPIHTERKWKAKFFLDVCRLFFNLSRF